MKTKNEIFSSVNELFENLEIREKYVLRKTGSILLELDDKQELIALSVLENIVEKKDGTMREALVALKKIRDREVT
jgi:hypothetical protein